MSTRSPHTVAVTVALLACRSVAPARVAPARVASAMPAGVSLAASAPTLARAPGPAGVAGLRAVMGGRRVELIGTTARVSDEAILDEVVVAAECARAWVFVSAAGMVLASETFTGPLRRLGELPRRADVMDYTPWTKGRVALVDGRRLWLTDGASLEGPTTLPRLVRGVTFLDAQRGLAALPGGGALVTDDGGATWRPLPSLREPIRAPRFDGQTLRVTTAQGERALSRDGTLSDVPDRDVPEPPVQEARAWSIALAWHRVQGACAGGVRLGDGTCVSVGQPWRGPEAPDPWRPVRDRVFAFAPEPATHRVLLSEEGCAVGPFADGAAVVCRHAWRTDDGVALDLLPMPQGVARYPWSELRVTGAGPSDVRGRQLLVSRSGTVAVAPGRCTDDGTFVGADTHACVLDVPRRQSRALTFPPDARWRVEDASADALLLVESPPVGETRRVVQPLDAGSVRAVTIDGGGAPARLAFSRDGVLHGTLRDGDRSVLVRGDGTGPLRRLPLPVGATAASLRDARFGVARGPSLDAVWRTFDGGASWQAVALPLDGAFPDGREEPLALTCDAARCAAGPFSLDEGPVPTTRLAFAPRRADPPPTDPWSLADLRCVRDAAATPPSSDAPTNADDAPVTAERAYDWAMAHAGEGAALAGGACLVGASDRGALVCLAGAFRWLASPTHATSIDLPMDDEVAACMNLAALPTADGGLLLGGECQGSGRAVVRCALGLRINPAGEVVVRAEAASEALVLSGVARVGGGDFIATVAPGGRVVLTALDGAAEPPELPLLPRAPALCGEGAAATDVLQVIARLPVSLDGFTPTRSLDRVTFERRGDGWCLRALASLWWDGPPLAEPVRVALRPSGSSLRGDVRTRGDQVAVRCEVTP
jgi:hypothetical protein